MKTQKVVALVPGKIRILLPFEIQQIRYLYFGEVSIPIEFFKQYIEKFEVEVSIQIIPYKKFFDESQRNTLKFSKYIHLKNDQIFFFRRVLFWKFGISIQKQGDSKFTMLVTPHYFKYIKERVGNLCPFGVHLSDLLYIEMLKRSNFVFYGGSFLNTKRDEASLVVAPSGVGKTRSLLGLVRQGQYKLLGEEVTFVDCINESPYVVCTPHTSVTNLEKHNIWVGLFNSIYSSRMKSLFDKYEGNKSFSIGGKLKRIYILENSTEDHIEKIEFSESLRKIVSIQNLFTYFSSILLQAGTYNETFNLIDIRKKEEVLLHKIISSVSVYCIKAKSSETFHLLIQKIENDQR